MPTLFLCLQGLDILLSLVLIGAVLLYRRTFTRLLEHMNRDVTQVGQALRLSVEAKHQLLAQYRALERRMESLEHTERETSDEPRTLTA